MSFVFKRKNRIPVMTAELVLASESPRRFELLKGLGIKFRAVRSEVDESRFKARSPEELVKKLALAKAQAVARKLKRGVVVGADTIVVLGGEILGKPSSQAEARAMLKRLSGRKHEVLTGVAVVDVSTGKQTVDCVRTEVKFRKLTEEEISSYVGTGEPLDKAGSYAIQGRAGLFVERIKGCYYNVVGLPLARLAEILRDYGVSFSFGAET